MQPCRSYFLMFHTGVLQTSLLITHTTPRTGIPTMSCRYPVIACIKWLWTIFAVITVQTVHAEELPCNCILKQNKWRPIKEMKQKSLRSNDVAVRSDSTFS